MKTILPARRVRERYSISARTLYRWLRRSALSFPAPTFINGRMYFDEDALVAWERNHAACSTHTSSNGKGGKQ